VEKNTDKDMFKITLPVPGRMRIDATPFNVGSGNIGSNLDLQVVLYNNAQAVINSFNPGTSLNMLIDTSLAAGVYYIRAEGRGNIYTPDYASLGQYSIQGTFTAASVLPLRKLLLKGRAENALHLLNWEIDADETVISQTLEAAADGVHFSVINSNTPSNSRSFTYAPQGSNSIAYRLKVLFDNNKEYYSNTVLIKSAGEEMSPKLLNTLVQNQLMLFSPTRLDYSIYNTAGSLVQAGILSNGTNSIATGNFARGVYYIQASDGSAIYKMRFIKN
jgi:Bacterial pre-peptidase C-terminal domain